MQLISELLGLSEGAYSRNQKNRDEERARDRMMEVYTELHDDIPDSQILCMGLMNDQEFYITLRSRTDFPDAKEYVAILNNDAAQDNLENNETIGHPVWANSHDEVDGEDLRRQLNLKMNIAKLHDDPEIQAALKKKQMKEESEKAEAWIQKMYAKYPKNPINHDQRAIAYDGGEKFVFFELEPSRSAKDAVELKWFQAYPQREGVGTKGLQQIVDDAKEDGITLTLFPWQHGRVSQTALIRFYKRLGFKPTSKGSKNMILQHSLTEGMHRDVIEERMIDKCAELFPNAKQSTLLSGSKRFHEKFGVVDLDCLVSTQNDTGVSVRIDLRREENKGKQILQMFDGDEAQRDAMIQKMDKKWFTVAAELSEKLNQLQEFAKSVGATDIEYVCSNSDPDYVSSKTPIDIKPIVMSLDRDMSLWMHWIPKKAV
jgi:hypothetical protein